VNARPAQRRTALVGASLLTIRGCPVRPHREQARSYRSGPHTTLADDAPAWESQCGRSSSERRSASPTAFPRGAWERLDARSVQRRTAPVGASLLAIRGCPVRPHREQARSYRSGPHTTLADGSHAPAWEPQCGRSSSERRSASPTEFPRGAWERLDARPVQRRTALVGASLLAIRGCPVRPHREQARSYRSGLHTALADGSHAPAWEPQYGRSSSERRSASPTAFPRGAWERSVLHACTKTPSPLVGDDCMDAGGRATQDAKAQGWGEGVLPLPASRRSAPTAAGELA